MAGEEIYIARLGAFIARALGLSASFATDLDTENLGLQMPDAVVNDAQVKAAGKAMADAGEVLRGAADELEAAIQSGDEGQLVNALLHMLEGIYLYVDGVVKLTDRIKAVPLPAADQNAVNVFAALMARKTLDQAVILLLETEAPRLLYLLRVLGLVDWAVIEATGNLHEPGFVRKDLKLERIKDLFSDPATHLATAHKWGTAQFDPFDVMYGALQFYHVESAVEVGRVPDAPNGDAYFKSGAFLWSRDSSVNPPGLMLDVSESISQSFDERVEIDEKWGIDFSSTLTFSGGVIFRLKPPFTISAAPKTGTIERRSSR